MKTAPATAAQLRAALVELFPAFEGEIDDDTSYGRELTVHTLMFDFTPFFGKNRHAFSERQLREFAELVNLAIGAPGPLENAMSTCSVECARRNRVLRTAIANARQGTAG
jgi:hypothetical protein